MKRRLVVILVVLVLSGVCGCQSAGPAIMVRSASDGAELPVEYSAAAVEVGRFVVGSKEYSYSGEYVKEYLVRKLAERGAVAGDKVLVIDGQVDFELSDGGGGDVEVKFEMADRTGGYTLGAVVLRDKLEQRDDEYVRQTLGRMAEKFWGRIYPAGDTIAVNMCKGWSEYDRRGRELAKRGDYVGALAELRRAIDVRPDDHAAIYNAGVICEAMGDYGQAKDYYRRAIQLERKNIYEAGYERVLSHFFRAPTQRRPLCPFL
jgi:tetratricopeptide (TPR) repeat protein